MKSCLKRIEPCTRRLSKNNRDNVQRSVNNEPGDDEVFKQSAEASPIPRIIPSNSIKKDRQASQLPQINEKEGEERKVEDARAKHEDANVWDSRIHIRSEMRNGANSYSQNNQLKDPIDQDVENNQNSFFKEVNSMLCQKPKSEPPNSFEINEDNVQKLNDGEKANKDESYFFKGKAYKTIQGLNVNTQGGSQSERKQQNDSKVLNTNPEEHENFVSERARVDYINESELRNQIIAKRSKIIKSRDLGIEPGGNETNLLINGESRMFCMVDPELKAQILKEGSQIEKLQDLAILPSDEKSELFMETESRIIYRVSQKIAEQIQSEQNKLEAPRLPNNESTFFLDIESRIIYKVNDKLKDQIRLESNRIEDLSVLLKESSFFVETDSRYIQSPNSNSLNFQNGGLHSGQNKQAVSLSHILTNRVQRVEDISLVVSTIFNKQASYNPDLSAKDFSLRDTLISVFSFNLKDSSISQGSKKKNPYLKKAEKSRSVISVEKTKYLVSDSQSSCVPRSPHENLYAKRYGISIFEQDLLNLREGSPEIGKILNFYLRYLEERVTKGLGILKTSSVKALCSDFYDLLCTTGDLKDLQKYFDSSDQKPIIERYERIIFLVNSSATNRWYIVIYKKDRTNKKTLNILTPEEPSKQGNFSVNIILNFQEKNDIVSNIFEYFAKDYVEQTLQRLASSEVDENYISNIPACQDPRDYGFYVLEMIRRAVFGSELGAIFESSSLVKFRDKFCEFIKYFGKQTGPELKFDHHI